MILPADAGHEPPLRVMALHALLYCERLFYLEEVEEIRVADANVYAGRRLHLERVSLDDETPELRSYEVSSESWRLNEMYRHPFTGQSMSYARIVELEARLLEKEWTGAPGLYARLRMR